MAQVIIRHIGICVADIERSSRFYVGALGFEAVMPITEMSARQ
jgi:catechol 2,3-dioxygenase-like lactoylglutathione lyase family enzyme